MRYLVKIVLFAVVFLSNQSVSAQSCTTPGCLGIHTYIDVNLTNDPVTDLRYLVYTIQVPDEGLMTNYYDSIMGPGSPHFSNYMGNTVDLYINKNILRNVVEEGNSQCVLDFLVPKYVDALYPTLSQTHKVQCHYHIILNISQ